jgi:ethanolamine kinase
MASQTLYVERQEPLHSIRLKRQLLTPIFLDQLLKAVNKRPGLSEQEVDRDSVLIRAYGRGTQVLIDRDRENSRNAQLIQAVESNCSLGECASHSLLSSHKLAPPLLARFENGLMYRFIQGRVCQPADLRRPDIWRGVARRLAEWHATLPISAVSYEHGLPPEHPSRKRDPKVDKIERLTPGKPSPNIWGVMQKWILALPGSTEKEVSRKALLQAELEWLVTELGDTPGIAGKPLVFGHCDLLCANVIMLQGPANPPTSRHSSEQPITSVSFIDYEYATPAPAAFDIANHFAEWGGFDCDFSVMPTRTQRRDFLAAYLSAYNAFLDREFKQSEMDQLFDEVDLFRGAPGLYWGIWALIQAQISQIDFNYANYAEIRLSEYWAWKEARNSPVAAREMPLRERRWATEDD